MTMEQQRTNPERFEIAVTQPELISIMEVLEGMQPQDLQNYKAKMLSEVSDREMIVRMINDTLDGYGVI